MTGERAQAYGQVKRALEDLSPSKLHPREQDVVREAADALLFCENLESDPAAEQALAELYELLDRLVGNDRLLLETADRLSAAVEACGPEVTKQDEEKQWQTSVAVAAASRSG